MSAIAFSNATDWKDDREARYFDIIKAYSKPELNEFPKLLGMLTDGMEEEPADILGGLFHKLELWCPHKSKSSHVNADKPQPNLNFPYFLFPKLNTIFITH